MKLAPSGRTLIVQPLPGIGDMVWHLPHIHAIAATTVDGKVDLLTKPRSQADRLLGVDAAERAAGAEQFELCDVVRIGDDRELEQLDQCAELRAF